MKNNWLFHLILKGIESDWSDTDNVTELIDSLYYIL